MRLAAGWSFSIAREHAEVFWRIFQVFHWIKETKDSEGTDHPVRQTPGESSVLSATATTS